MTTTNPETPAREPEQRPLYPVMGSQPSGARPHHIVRLSEPLPEHMPNTKISVGHSAVGYPVDAICGSRVGTKGMPWVDDEWHRKYTHQKCLDLFDPEGAAARLAANAVARAATAGKDLKATDEHGRRLYCRDGHRIAWDDARLPQSTMAEYIPGGLCGGGDTWTMHRVGGGYRSSTPKTVRLEHSGKVGWDRPGGLSVTRKTWYAVGAHSVGDEITVNFNCSHGHFTRLKRLSGNTTYERDWPSEIRLLEEPQVAPMQTLVENAIIDLSAQGWDFETGDRVRCPECIAEEAELEARLAELRDEEKA